MMPKENILEVKNLVKTYGDLKAVDDVSFDVKRGSLFAFLGPNGAGKSTTIKIITTLLGKDSGSFSINSNDEEDYIRRKIGVVFQDNVLDDFLTVEENLKYRGALYFQKSIDVNRRYASLVKRLKLEEIEKRKFKELSGGQKRRVEIARALFSNPEVLLLDEPTTGLDPETRLFVWETLNTLKEEENITIFLTTHYMEEAANADYIVIIDHGKIKVSGTPSQLRNKYSFDQLKIVPIDKKVLEMYLNDKHLEYKKIADQYVIKLESSLHALDYIFDIKNNLKQFEVLSGNLDDVFVNVIGDKYVSVE